MPNVYDKLAKMDAILDQKLQGTSDAGAQKQLEQMDRESLAAFVSDLDRQKLEREAGLYRTGREVVDDTPNNLIKGAAGLVTGLAASGQRQLNELSPTNIALDAVSKAGSITGNEGLRDAADLVRDRRVNETPVQILQGASAVDRALSARMSDISQRSDELLAADNAADQAAHLDAAELAIAQGANPQLAQAKRFAQDVGSGVSNLTDNTTAFSNTVVEQVPTLLLGAGARAAVAGEAVAARAALQQEAAVARALAAGNSGRAAGSELAKQMLREEARQTLATRNLMGMVGMTEGGNAFQSGANEILAADPQALAERFPDHAAALLDPSTSEEARRSLAMEVGEKAMAIQAPIATLSARLATGFELNPLSIGAGAGRSIVGKLGHAAGNIAGETAEEFIQSGTGELAGNLAMRAAGDEGQDLLDGVGVAAGQGAAASVGMSGAFQAPSLQGVVVRELAGPAMRKTAQAALNVADKVLAKGERVLNEAAAPARAQHAQVSEQLQRTAAQVEETATTLAPEQSAPIATSDDAIVTPALAEQIGDVDPAKPVGKATALARTLSLLTDPTKPLQGQDEQNANVFAVKTARQLSRWLDTVGEAMDATDDPAAKAAFEAMGNQVAELIESDKIQELEAKIAGATEEDLKPFFDAVNAAPEGGTITPELEQAHALLREVSLHNPAVILPVVDKMLMQRDLSDEDRAHLQGVQAVGVAMDAHTARRAELPKTNSPDITRQSIREAGFQGRPSLKQHVQRISQAMGAGNLQQAKHHLESLAKFATHMGGKALGFDGAVIAAIENGKTREPILVHGYKTLDENGELQDKPFTLHMGNENSMGTIDHIYADADVAAATYNAMAKAYPKLIEMSEQQTYSEEDDGPLPRQMEAMGQPKWKTVEGPNQARGTRLTEDYNRLAAARFNMRLVENLRGQTVLQADGPMTKRQKSPKVFDPGGAKLTPKQVENLLAGRLPTEYANKKKGTNAATATDAAPAAVEQSAAQPTVAAEAAPAVERKAEPVEEATPDREQVEADPAVDNAVDQAQNDADELAKILASANAAVAANEAGKANQPEPKTEGSLDEALGMSGEAYLAAINPSGKVTPESESDYLVRELYEDDLREQALEAEVVREEGGITYRRNGDFIYAMEGDTLVGHLASISTGTTSAVKQEAQYKGRGIGYTMLKELLRTKPFAPAGSLTEAAGKARLRALRELRAEQDAKNAKTVAARYPGPLESTVEITPDTDATTKLKAQNRLFTAFQLNDKSRALFARMTDPVSTIVEALTTAYREKNKGVLAQLFVREHQHTDLETIQISALRAVFEKFLPEIVERLNFNLYSAATNTDRTMFGQERNGKSWLDELIDNPGKAHKWQYLDNVSLHGAVWGRTENGEPFIHYQPEVAQAMALAGLHWVLNNINSPIPFDREKVAKMFNDGLIPSNLIESFEKGIYYKGPVRTIGADIIKLLGLQPKNDAPVTHTDSMGKALAADVLRALIDMDVLDLDRQMGTETSAKGGTAELHFLRFNKDSDVNNWDDPNAPRSIQRTRDALGSVTPLTRMLFPDSEDLVRIGTPGKEIPSRVSGTGHPMSQKQKKQVQLSNQTAHYRNSAFKALLGKLGTDNFLRLRGYYHGDMGEESALNKMHKRVVEGINQGLRYQIDGINEIDDLLEEYAAANGTEADDTPMFWNYRVTSNGRLMQNGFGPQGYKLARELFTPNRAVLDLNNETHDLEFHLAVAQALGVKTEKMSNAAAVKKVKAMLATKEFADILTMMVTDDTGPQLTQALEDLSKTTKEVVTERGMNALLNAALFNQAKEAGDKSFTTYLAFELDGKTDGPINAMVHFGLHSWGQRVMQQLRQGGLFIGDLTKTTLNEEGTELGDLYQNVSDALGRLITDARNSKHVTWTEKRKRKLELALDQMADLGHVKIKGDDRVIDTQRSFSKHGMVSSVYGSGAYAVINAIVYEAADKIYAQISDAIKDNTPLSAETQARIKELMGEYYGKDPVDGKKKWLRVTVPDLSNIETYKDIRFSDWNMAALHANLTNTVGGLLTSAIHDELQPIRETFTILYQASGLQTAAFKKAYAKAYDARRKQLVAEGKLLEKDALSREDEQKIVADLKHLLPTYATPLTNDGELDTGITASLKDYDGEFVLEGGQQERPESIAGGLPSEINVFGLQHPGVRAAALYTIGLGDATMMGLMFDRVRQMLNVFDGLEVSVGAIKDAALRVNETTIEGWKFDALGSVRDVYSKIELDPKDFSRADLEQLLVHDLRILNMKGEDGFEAMSDSALRALLGELVEGTKGRLEEQAAKVAAVKQVIFDETPHASDHMSGGANPAIGNGDRDNISNPVAYVQERAAAVYEASPLVQAIRGATVAATDEALVKRLSPETDGPVVQDGVRSYDRAGLSALLEKFPFTNKMQGFVYAQIKHLIPADIQVHFGRPDAIAAKIAQVAPGVAGIQIGKGAFYRNHIFVTVPSAETLTHELVHATTFDLVRRFYMDKAPGLNQLQISAISALEKLTREFLELDFSAENQATQDAAEAARATITRELAAGDTAAAVNEFMAWALTNPFLQRGLAKQRKPKSVERLGKLVLEWVRKLLKLPNNSTVESFLESAFGHFALLADNTKQAPDVVDKLLNQIAEDDVSDHASHVRRLASTWRQLMALPRRRGETRDNLDSMSKAFIVAKQVRDDFLDAGWEFTDDEVSTFTLTQVMLASGIQLDAQVMISLERLHKIVSDQVKPEHFLADPANATQTEFEEAYRKHSILFGVGRLREDQFKRSNLLANFVALGLVNPEFRQVLSRLDLPKAPAMEKTADGALRHLATLAFDKLGDAALKVSPEASTRAVLDQLTQRLLGAQEEALKRAQTAPNALTKAEVAVRNKIEAVGDYLDSLGRRREAAGKDEGLNMWINSILGGLAGLTSAKHAEAFAEGHIRMLNESGAWTPIRELGYESIGVTPTNRAIAKLLNTAKHLVARARQRLREEVPGQIREMFSKELSKGTWEMLHKTAKADLQSLLDTYDLARIHELVEDPNALVAEINSIEAGLGQHGAIYAEEAQHLATYLMTGYNDSRHLMRNAHALARLVGRPDVMLGAEPTAELEASLDRLVTLKGLAMLSTVERAMLGELLATEAPAMEQLLNTMRAQVRSEQLKPGASAQRYNVWKGYVPESRDPRKQLVLASAAKGAELLKLGYERIADYRGDASDRNSDLGYYATTAGGPTTYNQGALQTVEGTVNGVDRFTGRTLGPNVRTMVTHERTVQLLRQRKFSNAPSGRLNMLPVHNAEGELVGYERVLDPRLLDEHTNGRKDLADSIGMWLGRNAEESIARKVNIDLAKTLKDKWDAEKRDRAGEYVDITKAKGAIAGAWEATPREMKELLENTFGDDPIMVRKDMINNALGYRSLSVGDVFTQVGMLPVETQRTIAKVAAALMGKDAYKYLVIGERAWQGLVYVAKDTIVVRSGVVGLANIMANQLQLLAMGVPVTRLLQVQLGAVREVEAYLRGEKRLAQIAVERNSTTDADALRALAREEQMLIDAQNRLSIMPLIRAGELPSIAEGLNEQDQYTLMTDATRWVQERVNKLPSGLSTAARYAAISKDTALYQGLNRMIQFGDFMAKAALYQQRQLEGKTEQEALDEVNESFVNYNLLPGQTRDYLESMGLTWFLNYKIRIQKIIARTVRQNPLRMLLDTGIGHVLNVDTLVDSSLPAANWSYALGPEPIVNAPDMLMWNQF